MSNESLYDIVDNYTLKRIVYVNSAEYGYAELELDQHLAIYGNNNSGKTSTLSGTKIMLFPEVSFGKCDEKFMFVNKSGDFYDADDSYQHYFPDSRSFIIMEVENPHGLFSMVCFRTNNYNYARFFIPSAYSEIRELFSVGDEGELNPDLSITLVSDKCKELGGIRVSDKKELASLMFGSRLESIDRSRFCVLPLRDSKPGTIAAFRNIYQLAFDSGSSASKTLPTILATLVEMKRGRSQEKLDANLSALIEARNRLVKDSDWIQEVENAKSVFDGVWGQLKNSKTALKDYALEFHSLGAAIISFKKNVMPRLDHLKVEKIRLNGLYKDSSKARKNAEEKLKELRFDYKSKKRHLEKEGEKLNEALKVREIYSGTDDEITIELLERVKDAEKELELFKKEDGVAKRYQELIQKQNRLRSRREHLASKLAENEGLFFTTLNDEHAISVLNSINPLLSGAPYNLRSEQRDTVIEFTSMFGFDATDLITLNGSAINPDLTKMEFNEKEQITDWQAELRSTEDRLNELKGEIESLSEKLKNDDIEGIIEDCEVELKRVKGNLEKVKSIKTLEISVREGQIEFDELGAGGKSLALKVEGNGELKVRAEEDFNNLQGIETELIQIKLDMQVMEDLENDLNMAKSIYEPRYIEPNSIPLNLTRDMGKIVLRSAQLFQNHLDNLKGLYYRLINRVEHPDIDKHVNLSDFSDLEKNIRIFSATFENIEYSRSKLNDEIAGHNGHLNSQLNELREARETVKREVSDIDSSLNENTVSNLSEITLQVEFEPIFLNIMSTLDKHDVDGESLLEEEFYKTLSKLVNGKYYNSTTGRIKLRDIIKSVRYSFTKKASGKSETKGQSGGTTTTISSFVLSVLLDRVSDAHTKLKMPIIVDEIGTLDNLNKKATIEQVAKHGFSIFCATPTYLAAVSKHVGRHVYINMNNLSNPMVESCYMKCIPKFVERFGEKRHAN